MNPSVTEPRSAGSRSMLAGCTLVVTRPRPGADALSRHLRQRGAVVVRLPGQIVRGDPDFDWPAALRQAADIDGWIFVSPSAVLHAARLFDAGLRGDVIAVGAGTARALHRRGLSPTAPHDRQNSEGLLALPMLADVRGRRIAVIGAPGGRGLIAAELRRRGAEVTSWNVYRREAPRWTVRQLAALDAASTPLLTLLSSAETLDRLVHDLPATAWARLRDAHWIASSQRLAVALRQVGADRIAVAASAGTRDMTNAAIRVTKR